MNFLREHAGKFLLIAVIMALAYWAYESGWISESTYHHDLVHLFVEAVR